MDKVKTIQCSPGIALAYRDEGLGTPILLVHGWGVSGALFKAQIDGLSDRYRLIAPDLPGHGASGVFPANGSFSILADNIAELVSELDLKNVVLAGWSLGAMISWDLLLRYPELDIAGLVTIDMVPRLLSEQDWQYGLRSGSGIHVFDPHVEAMNTNWPEFATQFVRNMFSSLPDAQTQELTDSSCAVALSNDPGSLAQIWMRMAEQDFRESLPGIAIPALIMAGQHSQLYSVTASEWVASRMPQARLIKFSRSGHAPHMEEPERFNRLLTDFVDSVVSKQNPNTQFAAQASEKTK
ncbi:MAG: alpha/beta hydrolase [Gammaproteobacteria bacterium]|nr:MAG: alpha/beta hydrolase [Gammaproteobacteria bacterium]